MWKFGGNIEYTCDKCDETDDISISEDDFYIECIGGSERSMGDEYLHEISIDLTCKSCNNEIHIEFEVSEYPIEHFNFALNNSTGAETHGEPEMIYLEEIYHAKDIEPIENATKELINEIKNNPERIRNITSREFEMLIAEIFEKQGFQVELTQRTRDGGKDIIAISRDKLGIKTKYFIECKHYSEDNKVGVDIVRSLHGVKTKKRDQIKQLLLQHLHSHRERKNS